MTRPALRPLALLVAVIALALAGLTVLSGPATAVRASLIEGVVVDQFGEPVDDVSVIAVDENGDNAASAFTYASAWEDGPQHGYFYLLVPAGTYTLELEKDGYRTATVEEVEVFKRRHTALGEVEVQKRLDRSRTSLVTDNRYSSKKHVEVTLVVSARSTRKPTGTVLIKEGRRVLERVRLRESARGRVEVDLGRLDKGTHRITAYYSGSERLKASTSPTERFEVVKPRKHRRPLVLGLGAALPTLW